MSYVLEVKNISKIYKEYSSEIKRIVSWFGINPKCKIEHKILNHISFNLKKGETVGVLGKNGAGKSTLLKIITGTLKPSTGEIKLDGNISAILELGMGFHPDLTGRDNVYNTAGLMGYTHSQVDKLIKDIEKFADIGEYFDEPVRVYSSGMQVRVAFSVSTAFNPSLLIIDEALSVGDAAFQRKCYRRIEELQENGTALLFVSHDIEAIKKICNRAIYIKNGTIVNQGKTKEVCDVYEKSIYGHTDTVEKVNKTETIVDKEETDLAEISYGDGKANINDVWIETESGVKTKKIVSGETFKICFEVDFYTDLDEVGFSTLIKTREGIAIYGTNSKELKSKHTCRNGEKRIVKFELVNSLAPGNHYINCGVYVESENGFSFLHRRIDTLVFKIVRSESTTVGNGLAELNANIELS